MDMCENKFDVFQKFINSYFDAKLGKYVLLSPFWAKQDCCYTPPHPQILIFSKTVKTSRIWMKFSQ